MIADARSGTALVRLDLPLVMDAAANPRLPTAPNTFPVATRAFMGAVHLRAAVAMAKISRSSGVGSSGSPPLNSFWYLTGPGIEKCATSVEALLEPYSPVPSGLSKLAVKSSGYNRQSCSMMKNLVSGAWRGSAQYGKSKSIQALPTTSMPPQ